MPLHIQDPTDKQAPLLHEIILEVCEGAAYGGGAFAFATRDGVDLLINDAVFKRFAKRGSFSLVVGIDEVTNLQALASLQEASNALPGLTVRAFYHNLPRPLFHPKFCWFRHGAGAFLIAGSGNLTGMGLRGNWEAFSVDELDGNAADHLETQWTQWVDSHSSHLRTLDDNDVLTRAASNIMQRRPGERVAPAEEEQMEAADAAGIIPPIIHPVLIAEIPAGSDRWNQANFSLATFRDFFGADPGRVQRIVLQHVDAYGGLAPIEQRPSVSVPSRNFRFELKAAAGMPYPKTGRPIAVFVETAPRTFRYRLLMPSNPQHRIVNGLLDTLAGTARNNRMRRVMTATDILRQAWPTSPLWRVPLEVQD